MMEDGNPNGFYVLKFNNVELIPEFIPFPLVPMGQFCCESCWILR